MVESIAPHPRGKTAAPRCGMALVLVLGLVALLSIVVTYLLTDAIMHLREQAWQASRSQNNTSSQDALQVVLGSLAEIVALDADLHSPLQGWDTIELWAAQDLPDFITLSVVDLSGRLSISNPSHDQLLHLFAALDLPLDQQQQLSDALLDWIDEDDQRRLHGAERKEYQAKSDAGPIPPNRPLVSLDELRYIQGFTPLFFTEEGFPTDKGLQLLESVTVHHQLPINLNTANSVVLHALFPQQEYAIAEFLRQRDGAPDTLLSSQGRYWKNPQQIQALLPGYSRRQHGVSAHTLLVVIEDTRFDPNATYPVIVRRGGSSSSPSWSVQALGSGQ